MIVTIPLDRVLQEAVATPYRDLVTRPTGAAVRSRIEARMAPDTVRGACLDFSEVGLVDFSCADEVVAKLLLASQERCVVLTGLTADHREAIEHVLHHHRIAVVTLVEGTPEPVLLGWVPDDARDAWHQLPTLSPRTGECLAAALDWTVDRADAALGELAARRLVRMAHGEYHRQPFA